MCLTDQIKSFNCKASDLHCDLTYAYYKEIQFGNMVKAAEYEKSIQDIKSIKWLLNTANGCSCSMALCGNAAGDWTFDSEQIILDTLSSGTPPDYNETWKGNLYNPKRDSVISLSTYTPIAGPNNHTGIRLYEWKNGVATKIYELDGILDASAGTYTSFYYSASQNAYYLKAGNRNSDVMSPTVFKIHGDLTTAPISRVIGARGNTPSDTVMEVVEELNLLLVRIDSDSIEAISLVDLSSVKTISTTGFPYQKMTWNKNECNLFLTGQGSGGNAVMHLVDIAQGTIVNHLDDSSLRNNTSLITKSGQLLIMTTDPVFPNNTLQFQRWNTCNTPTLLETIDTGLDLAIFPDFFNLMTLSEDKNGNIYVTYISDPSAGAVTSLTVFDKNFNIKYTKNITPIGLDFGIFSANFAPSWTNTPIVNSDGSIYIHSSNQNGSGGEATYYLDYTNKNLQQVTSPCVELTEDEVCSLINKLNGIPKPRKYKTPTGGINSNISYVNCCEKLFVYKQTTPATEWLIVHNLNSFPVIVTTNMTGQKIQGTETYIDNNTVKITFSSPVTGIAYLTYNIV